MAYTPKNPNGQATMANSTPVVIASDQSAVPTSLASVPSHPVTNAGTFAVQVTSAPTTAVTGTFWQATQPVSIAGTVTTTGGLTDTQLRATPVPVSGTVTANTGLAQPLTDTQLRATAVPVSLASTTVTGSVAVTGPLTDTQLRASAVPTSLASVPTHPVTQSGTWTLGANSGVDIGDVTINNAAGASAVNIQDGGNSITVDGTVAVSGAVTIFNGTVDAGNSSTTTLAANGTFTGAWLDAFNQGSVLVYAFSNVSSATNGITFQWSSDGTNADETYTSTFVAGGTAEVFQLTHRGRYFRLVYTNGATIQASFRLNTIHKVTTPSGDVNELTEPVTNTSHSMLTTGLVAAKNAASTAVAYVAQSASAPAGTEVGLITRPILPAAMPTTPVTGTFWQATQPVSIAGTVTTTGGLTDTQLRATAVPVSLASVPSHAVTNAGTFAVQVTSAPTTAVTGTFWQATQPVSIATMPSTPVTGTFWQATQPVSGTVSANATLSAETTKVIGTVNVAAGQSIAATQSGTWNIGSITTMPTTPVTGTFWQATQPVSIAATVTTAAAANSTGTQSNPSLSNVSATLLASNASRKAATVYNNSSSIVYVRLSATAASATTFTVKLNPTDYYEVPGFYSGALTAILDTGTTTAVQVTEIT